MGIVILFAAWVFLGLSLLDLNADYWDAPLLNKILAGLIIVIFAPFFLFIEMLYMILGFLIGEEDEEDEG